MKRFFYSISILIFFKSVCYSMVLSESIKLNGKTNRLIVANSATVASDTIHYKHYCCGQYLTLKTDWGRVTFYHNGKYDKLNFKHGDLIPIHTVYTYNFITKLDHSYSSVGFCRVDHLNDLKIICNVRSKFYNFILNFTIEDKPEILFSRQPFEH